MLLTKSEAAEFLSVSLSYFKAKIQPLLPCVRTGRLVRFDRRDLERWAEERKVGPSDVQTQTVLSTFGSRIKEKVTNSRREQEILMKLRPRPRNATRRSSLAVEHLEPLPRAVEYEKNHAKKTADNATMYARAHWMPFFGSLDRITSESAKAYARHRLTETTRVTVRKELSALRQFVEWAEMGIQIPGLPRHGHPGKRAKNARKPKATVVEPAVVEKILAAMPERMPRRPEVWLQPFFRVLWETRLRESTVFRLRAGEHYVKGAGSLFITRDIDKAFDERDIPLTQAAREALDKCVPDEGPIFPKFNLREPLERACVAAGVPIISPYDLRHSGLSAWANAGAPLPGVQYLAGHQTLSTTAKYIQPKREAALEVILGGIPGGRGPGKRLGAKTSKKNRQQDQPSAKGGT